MRLGLIISLFFIVSISTLSAQPVFTPMNMALGGGGSTYITDYHANFYNPANLMIQDQDGTFYIGVGSGGIYMNAVQNFRNPEKQFQNYKNNVINYREGEYDITADERNAIIDDNYSDGSVLSSHNTHSEVTLLGMKWTRNNRAFSLALRSRSSTNYSVGKGWYSNKFEDVDGKNILNRSLIQRFQTIHEISFGYAESFQFLTGLTPRLDNFVIGIAPKLIIAGPYQNAIWENEITQTDDMGLFKSTQSFNYSGSGEFGNVTNDYIRGANAQVASNQHKEFSHLTTSNGLGAGLDIGITYLLTLGDDLTAVRRNNQPTKKSLRVSFSITDIGIVSYTNEKISLQMDADTSYSDTINPILADEQFVGVRGQYVTFMDQFSETNPFDLAEQDPTSFSVLLPMALHGGVLVELNRIKLAADLSYGLTNNAFNNSSIMSSLGIELRPLKFLPLRAGVRLQAQRPEFLSIGTAIETKKWDFSVAAQFTPNSLTTKPTITGVSVATLQFHF